MSDTPVTPLNPASEPQSADFRQVPHNIEAEQGLLGALLINNDALDQVADFLKPAYFHDPVHQRIFEAISKLVGNGNLASPVTLKTYLEMDEGLVALGGVGYLARLASNATTIANAKQYGRTIYDLAIRRLLIIVGQEMIGHAFDADIDEDPDDQIDNAEQALYNIAEKGTHNSGFMTFDSSLTGAIEMAEKAYQRDGNLSGISTGFDGLNSITGGLQDSDLVILAGRPAMGKTALATNIAFNIAHDFMKARQSGNVETKPDGSVEVKDGGVVGFFSLEMAAEQLATRMLAEQAGVSSSNIRKGDIHEDEYSRLVSAARDLQDAPLFIDHTGAIPIATLAARARRLKRQQGLGLIVVDYLQLVRASSGRDGRVQEVTEITQGLKALAKELDVPVLALAQLSRQVEQRDDKRPQLSDLRESGSIEQDADIVMFVYREPYYLAREKPQEGTEEFFAWKEKMDAVDGTAEVIIAKNRHGPTGTAKMTFEDRFTRFTDLQEDDRLPERFD
ncbi:MAG: replicative DNA helicase [Alphaproteobacteria bacterium]|nr:replicative DNA helicase [Alphaproteobacteria bacterium]